MSAAVASEVGLWIVGGVAALVVVLVVLIVQAFQLHGMSRSIEALGRRLQSAERWYDSEQGQSLDRRIDELSRRIDLEERNQATFEIRLMQLPTAEQLAGAHSKIDSFRREFDHFDSKLSDLKGEIGRVNAGVDSIQQFLMERGK